MCAFLGATGSDDLNTLLQKHTKELYLSDKGFKGTLSASCDFPYCQHFTRFTAHGVYVNDSVPAAFMKAVTEGKLPNLRRIELIKCTMNDCEWPEVPEFSCDLYPYAGSAHLQKYLLNLTELTYYRRHNIDCLMKVRLEKLTVFEPVRRQCS